MTNILQKLLGVHKLILEQAVLKGYLEFSMANGKRYRIRPASPADKEEAEQARQEYFMQLFSDTSKKFLVSETLIKRLKEEQGIDIEKIDEQIRELGVNMDAKMVSLARLSKNEEKNEQRIEEVSKEIEDIFNEQKKLMQKRDMYMQYSIEEKADRRYFVELLVRCTDEQKVTEPEKPEDERKKEWIRKFKNYEEWMNTSEDLKSVLSYYAGSMFFQREEENV